MHPTVHHLLLGLSSTLLLLTTADTAIGRGLSIELIPPFSERSPFYPGNLTRSQRLQWLVQSSASHARWLESSILGPNTTAIRPPLQDRNYDYVVSVDIGTAAGQKPQLLLFDTGSSLTWSQCKPCSPCFPGPQFNTHDSPTYRALQSSDHRCAHPYGPSRDGKCVYQIPFLDGTFTSGVLSTETFTFKSDRRGQPETFDDLIFGCGHSNKFPTKNSDWTGFMGMSSSPVSLAMKLSGETGRFSYCLVKPSSGASSFLRFGDDYQIRRHSQFQRMDIIIFPDAIPYYLPLNDVSLGGHRFHFETGYFARREDRTRGCFLDTGATLSRMIRPAYDIVTEYLTEHFTRQHLYRIIASTCNFELEHCFTLPDVHLADVLLPMTLHFKGADLRIGWENTYFVNEDERCFCFAVMPHDHLTVLGAYQQADTRFVFEVNNRELWFAHEDCENDGHHS